MTRRFVLVATVAAIAACGGDQVRHIADAPHGDAPPGAAPYPGIYVTNQDGAIAIFDLDGSGDVAPIRTISGAATGLQLPIGLGVDHQGNVYTADRIGSTVSAFPPGSTGNISPLRTLTAPGMLAPETLAVDVDDDIFIATCPSCGQSSGGDIGVFHFAAGSSASDSNLEGSDTGLTNPYVALDSDRNLVVANAFGGLVETFAAGATGDAAPIRSFTPSGSQNTQAVVAGGGVILLSSPSDGIDIYDAMATGTASPAATIAPSAMLPISYPAGMYLDVASSPPVLYLADYGANAIYVIQTAGTLPQLSVASVRTITGASTTLDGPLDVILAR